ncbi:MAG: preprotein translocase subunit SecY [Actinobacteria bacterium]|nr:preprotein translocase subunit SecY [Actinomycetota bacterium]
MIDAIKNAFRLPDLRKRILFTLFIVFIYRIGSHIPTPGIPIGAVKQLFQQGGVFGFLDLFAGGALSQFAVFALGIMPYITASIVMQLLTLVIPTLEEWSKEGDVGQRKIAQWTRYLTLFIATVNSISMTLFIRRSLSLQLDALRMFTVIITLIAGTAIIMWLAELITQHGIGNGMSLLIFVSIVSRFPDSVVKTYQATSPLVLVLTLALLVLMFIAIIYIELAQRRIPVQYAKRVVGRRVYGGGSTYLPVKINSAGVIPIIFAASFLVIPSTIAQLSGSKLLENFSRSFGPGSLPYMIVYFILIILFAFFYSAIVFNPVNIAENLQKWGGFVPGVRPGRPTAEYLNRILTRITLPGAIFIALVAIVPPIFLRLFNVPFFGEFGGTSILILVGVALESARQIEAQLLMRHYEGFIK